MQETTLTAELSILTLLRRGFEVMFAILHQSYLRLTLTPWQVYPASCQIPHEDFRPPCHAPMSYILVYIIWPGIVCHSCVWRCSYMVTVDGG